MVKLVVRNDDEETCKKDKRLLEHIDPRHVDMIVNPAYHAFKKTLEEFEKTPTNELLEEFQKIMLIDGSLRNYQILELLPKIYPYIKNTQLYHNVCLLLCEVVHFNEYIQESLLVFGIFDYLDYDQDISYYFILSMCDCNSKITELFKNKYMNEKIKNNHIIKKFGLM